MKKYESIMKRVRFIEDKYGIKYAKVDGKLFSGLKVCFTLSFIWAMIMNLLLLAGVWLQTSSNIELSNEFKNAIITISVCSIVLILGFTLVCTKLKISGAIVSIASLPMMLISFAGLLKDDLGFLGFKLSFYWRHFAPIVLMAIFATSMIIIAVREKYKTNKQYKKIIDNLYKTYSTSINTDGEKAGITDDQWEEFLKNYDPRDQKKIPVKITADEEDKEGIED